ncbi:MAG: leucine-rich repeat domain-containing protein [Acutalibacteraceae bacterium]
MNSKKIKSVIVAVVALILSLSALTASAHYDETNNVYTEDAYTKIIDNVVYEKTTPEDGTQAYYSVLSFSPTREIAKTMTKINIVSQINGVPVTKICGNPWEDIQDWPVFNIEAELKNGTPFYYPKVTEITIPETVTEIEDGAFMGLKNITQIKLPSKLTSLGSYVFYRLGKLKEITIPVGIERIGWSCFEKCLSLEKVTFKGDIKVISTMAFKDCRNLEKITDCNSLRLIDFGAFYGCSKLDSFVFPETLTWIGYSAFAKTGLVSVTIPSKVHFGSYDESYCTEYGTFGGCKSLKTVIFENREGTVYLIDNLFNGCTALETVVFPASARVNIFARVFKNCTNLKNLANTERIEYIREAGFAFCKSLKSIRLTSRISCIEKKAFLGCTNLTSVTYTGTKAAPDIQPKAFSDTPERLRFFVKNNTVAAGLKKELKGSGVNNARIYVGSSNKLTYKDVK